MKTSLMKMLQFIDKLNNVKQKDKEKTDLNLMVQYYGHIFLGTINIVKKLTHADLVQKFLQ